MSTHVNRRSLMGAALVAAPMALAGRAAACSAAIAADPFADLVGQWFAAQQAYENAADLPGGGDFDTPECLHWYAERRRIVDLLQDTPISGQDGAAALVRMIWRESDADNMEQPVIHRWMLAKLRDWTEAQLMMGVA